MIEVTPVAAERIRSLLTEDGKQESHGLRMKVIGGGCSGLQYQLSFDDVSGRRLPGSASAEKSDGGHQNGKRSDACFRVFSDGHHIILRAVSEVRFLFFGL